MKVNSLILIGMTTFLSLSSVNNIEATEVFSQSQSSILATKLETLARKVGMFQKGEHPTQGYVTIVKENGRNYLKLSKGFKSDEGPDLYIILYRNATVPISGIKEMDYSIVSKLKRVQGSQKYLIPDDINVDDFQSVAIWCRKFNATFGFASL